MKRCLGVFSCVQMKGLLIWDICKSWSWRQQAFSFPAYTCSASKQTKWCSIRSEPPFYSTIPAERPASNGHGPMHGFVSVASNWLTSTSCQPPWFFPPLGDLFSMKVTSTWYLHRKCIFSFYLKYTSIRLYFLGRIWRLEKTGLFIFFVTQTQETKNKRKFSQNATRAEVTECKSRRPTRSSASMNEDLDRIGQAVAVASRG